MMQAQSSSPQPSHAVLQQAARWYALMRDGTAETCDSAAWQAWQAWLKADPMHQVAWRYVQDIGASFAPLRGQPDTRLAADALGATLARQRSRRRLLAGAAAASGCVLAGWLGWRQALLPTSLLALAADYRTGVGEQRDIQLADGSRIWLNTASAINVEITASHRNVVLVEGEIFVATASDKDRPFFVHTDNGRIQALGTRFNVRQDEGLTRISVYEHAVRVHAAASREQRVLQAGQQADVSAAGISRTDTADAAREGWIHGALVADNIPLRQVVSELRRYRRGHLAVDDAVADLMVYGNFPIQDTDRVLRMLTMALPIRIDQPFRWWTTIEASHASKGS